MPSARQKQKIEADARKVANTMLSADASGVFVPLKSTDRIARAFVRLFRDRHRRPVLHDLTRSEFEAIADIVPPYPPDDVTIAPAGRVTFYVGVYIDHLGRPSMWSEWMLHPNDAPRARLKSHVMLKLRLLIAHEARSGNDRFFSAPRS